MPCALLSLLILPATLYGWHAIIHTHFANEQTEAPGGKSSVWGCWLMGRDAPDFRSGPLPHQVEGQASRVVKQGSSSQRHHFPAS